jgi:hypothetical protein
MQARADKVHVCFFVPPLYPTLGKYSYFYIVYGDIYEVFFRESVNNRKQKIRFIVLK